MTEQAEHHLLERPFLSLYDGTHTELNGTTGTSFETMELFKTTADSGEERAFSLGLSLTQLTPREPTYAGASKGPKRRQILG
jgi:hypothetical protein